MLLKRIVLRDFVIVESLDLELHPGFTALTGETGAGKSILIDALQLVLGSRADAAIVREGARQAELCAEFAPPAPGSSLHRWLQAHGFVSEFPTQPSPQPSPQPDTLTSTPEVAQQEGRSSVDVSTSVAAITHSGEEGVEPLLLRRTIDTQGRSRAWINGSPATAAQLRHLGDSLLDIHGQHAWQSLTRPDAVRDLLDAYAASATCLQPVRTCWAAWRTAWQELDAALAMQDTAQRERERLQWQIAELEKLSPRTDEWDDLNAQHTRLSHAQALLQAAQTALTLLEDDDSGAQTPLHRACNLLQDHTHLEPQFQPVADVLTASLEQLGDACHSLHAWLRHADLDPQRLAELDERLTLWMQLARRYKRSPQELPALLAGWHDELARLDAQVDVQRLRDEEARTRAAFDAAARQLTHHRTQAAPRLSQAITQAMQGLGMQGGRFEVQIHPADPGPQGRDAVQFLVAGHPGATPRPIAKVASGGELSRLSLAIAVTTSQLGTAGTLIFDEVDSGIGGAVAETVGKLMRSLGSDRQVLAVTHLPQVAACADWHCMVAKHRSAAGTSSTVVLLEPPQREREIARMLGGETISSTTLAHAREMLHTGQQARQQVSPYPREAGHSGSHSAQTAGPSLLHPRSSSYLTQQSPSQRLRPAIVPSPSPVPTPVPALATNPPLDAGQAPVVPQGTTVLGDALSTASPTMHDTALATGAGGEQLDLKRAGSGRSTSGAGRSRKTPAGQLLSANRLAGTPSAQPSRAGTGGEAAPDLQSAPAVDAAVALQAVAFGVGVSEPAVLPSDGGSPAALPQAMPASVAMSLSVPTSVPVAEPVSRLRVAKPAALAREPSRPRSEGAGLPLGQTLPSAQRRSAAAGARPSAPGGKKKPPLPPSRS